MDREKLLIIGCGDLGQRLAQHLSDQPLAITGVRRRATKDRGNLRYIAADIHQPDTLAALLTEDFDRLVITLTPAERSAAGYETGYVIPCERLVALCRRLPRPPRQILFASSTAVYGQDTGEWVNEQSLTQPRGYNGEQLLRAEQLLLDSGLPVSVLRLAGIYGPGRNRLLRRVAAGDAPLSDAWTNRIHAEDAAGFMAHLLLLSQHQPLLPVYGMSDGQPATSAEVVSWLAQSMGVGTGAPQQSANRNKRVGNRLLLATGYRLRYPDYRAGFGALLADAEFLPQDKD